MVVQFIKANMKNIEYVSYEDEPDVIWLRFYYNDVEHRIVSTPENEQLLHNSDSTFVLPDYDNTYIDRYKEALKLNN